MKLTYRFVLGLFDWLALCASVSASENGERRPLDPNYVSECGSCHVPYPPRMLRAETWQKILASLDKHFDVNASLDAEALKPISAYLMANASRKPAKDRVTDSLRISDLPWFRHEHDDISDATWSKVKSRSNCGGCHVNAQQGRYSESELKVPR